MKIGVYNDDHWRQVKDPRAYRVDIEHRSKSVTLRFKADNAADSESYGELELPAEVVLAISASLLRNSSGIANETYEGFFVDEGHPYQDHPVRITRTEDKDEALDLDDVITDTRTLNSLYDNDITELSELLRLTKANLLDLDGIGRKAAKHIVERVSEVGFTIRGGWA